MLTNKNFLLKRNVYLRSFRLFYKWVIKMKKKETMKSNKQMTDSCNKSNVSNKSNAKATNKASKNIGFENEASSFEVDHDNNDSFKLR